MDSGSCLSYAGPSSYSQPTSVRMMLASHLSRVVKAGWSVRRNSAASVGDAPIFTVAVDHVSHPERAENRRGIASIRSGGETVPTLGIEAVLPGGRIVGPEPAPSGGTDPFAKTPEEGTPAVIYRVARAHQFAYQIDKASNISHCGILGAGDLE